MTHEPRLSPSMLLALAAFSAIAVYCTAMSLHTVDLLTKSVAADVSIKEYRETLEGVRGFPYQWRLLGTYMVFAGERLTGLGPHTVDLALKWALLFVSSAMLFLFSQWYVTESGALAVVALYLLLTVAGFTDEQYRIYFTNDYVMIACWFAAVYLVKTGRYAGAAALAFVGAFAKETMLLVPVLLAFRAWRSREARGGFALAVAAFAVPTAIVRTLYRAPLGQWAWWDMVFANVPFLQSSMYEFKLTIKNNLKVALFYNVCWVMAARRVVTLADPFARDLAATGVVYLLIAYPVIYIRELRHFLPLAIVVLPLAVSAVEAHRAPVR